MNSYYFTLNHRTCALVIADCENMALAAFIHINPQVRKPTSIPSIGSFKTVQTIIQIER